MHPADAISLIKGVGSKIASQLNGLGIYRVGDLLLHLPTRYQDRSHLVPLRSLRAHTEALIEGQIRETQVAYGRRRSLKVVIEDGSGFLNLRFFHFSANQQRGLAGSKYIRCFGEVRFGADGLEMVHPEYRTQHEPFDAPTPELTPIYPTTKGLGQTRLRNLTKAACLEVVDDDWPMEAIRFLHEPPATSSVDDIERVQSQISLDELTAYYLVMRHRQLARANQKTLALPQAQHLGRALLERLGFKLTAAQARVTTEVLEELSQHKPMLRLVQGDVGSGKTVIAAFAVIRAAEHGAQSAIMAPTEILAEQHYLNLSQWLTPLGIEIVLLTGQQTARERKTRVQAIRDGQALVAVGTHALFQSSVEFNNLALTVVDEQHRFGVHQRMALRDKGRIPHQLVMTATPIPRTLTMALYADMNVSLIDEMPAGRQPIDTRIVTNTRRDKIIERIRSVLASGQQVYWVCTLIEPSESLEASAAESVAEELANALGEFTVGLLHGRMSSRDKASVMQAFKDRELNLLVATTVVEVGVDAPNATLIIIEDPDRLGLAQLHQLRGRVGRGTQASHCVLLFKPPISVQASNRLQVIRDSQDGFHIAEEDLKLRGPGELLGARQTGEQQFRVADLARDAHLIPEVIARGDALLKSNPAEAQRLLSTWAPADTGHISV